MNGIPENQRSESAQSASRLIGTSPKKITQVRLKEILSYNPDTGLFRWRKHKSPRGQKGDIAGSKTQNGYIAIKIDKLDYKAHRLAWLFVHGYFPEHGLDHINRDRADNRISNLREASQSCNIRNAKRLNTNTSGIKGVHWDKKSERWHAKIEVYGRRLFLGCYKDKLEAACARLAGEQCLEWSRCDSNSPAGQYVNKHLKRKGQIETTT